MKRVIFGLQTMVMGGVEKELIAILKHLDPKEYDVTVLLMYISDQSVIDMIPSNVRVINLNIDRNYYCSDTVTASLLRLRRGKLYEAASLMTKKLLGIGQTGSNTSLNELQNIEDSFDVAVCYHLHSPLMVKYMAEKVKAKKRLAWIHNDFSTSGYRVDRIKKYLSAYDEIIGVSTKITEEFNELCPQLASKTKVIYNALDRDEIIHKANELTDLSGADQDKNKLILLTVGRLEEQKGYDTAVKAAQLLNAKNIDFTWYVIGDGSKKDEIKTLISKSGLEDRFVLLGRKNNPYPYIKACNIYVQPSRHEGYPLTVLEAKILEKPIVCTDFAGANEQIKNSVNGIIVPVDDYKALADSIIRLNDNKDMQRLFVSELKRSNASDNGFSKIIECF